MVESRIPRKVFTFTNESRAARTLRVSFTPELVHVEYMTESAWKYFPWATFQTHLGEVEITLPAGKYRVTVFGSRPEWIERWETEGGYPDE